MAKTKIYAAGIYDGTGSPMQMNSAIIVKDGLVDFVGPRALAEQIPCDELIDCSGLYLFPGLHDCHGHVTASVSPEGKFVGQVDPVQGTLYAVKNCRTDLLECGITTERCLGERNRIDIACRDAIESGMMIGPRLVCAGQSIRSTHGHGIMASVADGIEELQKAARANILAGATICKLLTTGLFGEPGQIISGYTREEIIAFVDEAKRNDLPSTAHCIGGIAVKWCLEAGMESLEHGFLVSDEDIELFLKYDRWLSMTPGIYMVDERRNSFAPHTSGGMNRFYETSVRCMEKAIKAGVKFVCGSDGGHGNYARELECFAKLGATPEQIILGATRDAAIVCRTDSFSGTLEVGKVADIVGTFKNPLENISYFNDLGLIMKDGVVYKNAVSVPR